MLPSPTLMAVIAMTITSSVLSFTIEPSPSRSFTARRMAKINRNSRSHTHHTIHTLNLAERDSVESDGDDDDDGWGDEKVEVGTSSSIPNEIESSPSDDRISKSKELARLQNEMAAKQNRQRSSDPVNASAANGGGEKDLFIPIVTLVSVIGFTGLYGYEMLRLYSRGELYLPWDN
mmetsp:Transcript_23/g.58  ORF Transcript_23/g.58 Transcript_23/m.58 type:complete len:176 (+) Transcript_23:241-768(+)